MRLRGRVQAVAAAWKEVAVKEGLRLRRRCGMEGSDSGALSERLSRWRGRRGSEGNREYVSPVEIGLQRHHAGSQRRSRFLQCRDGASPENPSAAGSDGMDFSPGVAESYQPRKVFFAVSIRTIKGATSPGLIVPLARALATRSVARTTSSRESRGPISTGIC